jgi:hypothetical protein
MTLIVLTVIVGGLAYWARCQHQFLYGVLEIVIALVVIVLTFAPQTGFPQTASSLLVQGPSVWGVLLPKGIGASAGVYIMVRGLDNMEKGLPVSWRATWNRLFRASVPFISAFWRRR